MNAASRRLGELLVERKVLSRDALSTLLAREQEEGTPLPSLLAREGAVSERDLLAALAHQSGFPFVDLTTRSPNPSVEALVPAAVARADLALAVDVEDDRLLVAMADPSDAESVRRVEEASGLPVRPALACRKDLLAALTAVYGDAGQRDSRPAGLPGTGGPAGQELPLRGAEESGGSPGQDLLPAVASGPLPGAAAGGPHRSQVPSIADFEPEGELGLNALLARLVEMRGSDLHLSAGIHPTARVDGRMLWMSDFAVLNGSEIRRMLYEVLTQKQRERFEEDRELDTSHSVPGLGRFRVNVFLQKDSVGAVLRAIPFEVVPIGELGLPPVVAGLAELPRGLV
ncbi:MAG: hypothetical protein ACRDYD_09745, partial [Acidimicrobiales bacterium]